MHKRHLLFLLIFTAFSGLGKYTFAQSKYKTIPLPAGINGINEEFSGMDMSDNRLYLLPQYGSHKETRLEGSFLIYSISKDSIEQNIDGKDSVLTNYRTIKVKNLDQLPDSIKMNYQGFEAITLLNDQVFLSMETDDKYDYCFLIKGKLNIESNEISIDPLHFTALKRYPHIQNAGFESLTYIDTEHKLLALYEFNGMATGGIGFLIDPAFKDLPTRITIPFLPFRITDIKATPRGKVYGINYYWNGDYESYLNNNLLQYPEDQLKIMVPDLADSLNKNRDYLKEKTTCYARIVSLDDYKAKQWKQVAAFNGNNVKGNNWEGLVLFKKGALTITDANRNSKQQTTLSYFEF